MRTVKLDAGAVMNAALAYLERYAAAREGVRKVLQRRIQRAERAGQEVDHRAAEEAIDEVLQKLDKAGYLNDRLFAEGRVATLRRRGRSSVQVRQMLQLKGVAADDIAATLDTSPEAELAAAVQFAKRRRLGPFANPLTRADNRQKHLAALARAGFSMSLARRVVETETTDELLEASDER